MKLKTEAVAGACADFLQRWKAPLFAMTAILFAASLFLCTRVRVEAGFNQLLLSDASLPLASDEGGAGLLIVGLDLKGLDGSSAAAEYGRLLERLKEGGSWWKILSLPIGEEANGQGIFLSPDGDCRLVILDLDPSAPKGEWYPFLLSLGSVFPRAHVSGSPYIMAYTESEILREAPILLGLSALILFCVYLAMFRSLGCAVRLWFASLIPAVMTAALFPIINRPMTIYGLVAPVCALAISTAYCIHATRGLEETGGDLKALYVLKGPPIFLDYLTTFLGFTTLAPTGNPELRLLGSLSNAGTTIAFIIGFFILPLADPRVRAAGRSRQPGREAGQAACAAAGPRPMPLKPMSPRAFALRCAGSAAFLLLLAFLFSGWSRIELRATSTSAIFGREALSRDAAYLEGKFGSVDEIVLHVDTGREYGLVDMGLYDARGDFRKRLEADPLVFRAYDYTDVVGSILASSSTAGAHASGPVLAESDVEIGEALELFSSSSLSAYSGMLLDPSWRNASIRIRIRPGCQGKALLAAAARWTVLARESGIRGEMGWSGSSIGNALANRAMSRGQFWSVIAYFAAIFIVLLIVTRSLFKSALIVLPPIAAIFAAVGLSGVLSWPLDSGSALGLAIIAGIGIDDALVFVLTKDRTRLTLKSVVEASIILILTLASFLVSSFSLIAQVYVLVATGLVLSSASVLLVIPTLEAARERLASR